MIAGAVLGGEVIRGIFMAQWRLGEAASRRYWLNGHVGHLPTERTKGNSNGEEK